MARAPSFDIVLLRSLPVPCRLPESLISFSVSDVVIA